MSSDSTSAELAKASQKYTRNLRNLMRIPLPPPIPILKIDTKHPNFFEKIMEYTVGEEPALPRFVPLNVYASWTHYVSDIRDTMRTTISGEKLQPETKEEFMRRYNLTTGPPSRVDWKIEWHGENFTFQLDYSDGKNIVIKIYGNRNDRLIDENKTSWYLSLSKNVSSGKTSFECVEYPDEYEDENYRHVTGAEFVIEWCGASRTFPKFIYKGIDKFDPHERRYGIGADSDDDSDEDDDRRAELTEHIMENVRIQRYFHAKRNDAAPLMSDVVECLKEKRELLAKEKKSFDELEAIEANLRDAAQTIKEVLSQTIANSIEEMEEEEEEETNDDKRRRRTDDDYSRDKTHRRDDTTTKRSTKSAGNDSHNDTYTEWLQDFMMHIDKQATTQRDALVSDLTENVMSRNSRVQDELKKEEDMRHTIRNSINAAFKREPMGTLRNYVPIIPENYYESGISLMMRECEYLDDDDEEEDE